MIMKDLIHKEFTCLRDNMEIYGSITHVEPNWTEGAVSCIFVNKRQGCSTSEYKDVGRLQVMVVDNAMFREINLVSRVILLQSAPKDIPIILET